VVNVPKMPEFVPVPTVGSLVREGLAELLVADKDGNIRMAHLSGAGQARINKALVENGRRWRAYDEAKKAESVVVAEPEGSWPAWE